MKRQLADGGARILWALNPVVPAKRTAGDDGGV